MKNLVEYLIKESKDIKEVNEFYAKYNVTLCNQHNIPESLANISFSFSEKMRKEKFPFIENTGYEDMCQAVVYTLYNALKEAEDSETVAKYLNDSDLGYTNWKSVKDNKCLIHIEAKDSNDNTYILRIYRNDNIFKNIYKGFNSMNDLNDKDFENTVFIMLTEGNSLLGDRFLDAINKWIKNINK